MRNVKRLILAGIVTFIAGLIITFPARVAYQWFAPAELKLSGIDGSIWRGSAAQGYAGSVYLTNIKWSFQPLALLSGRLGFATSSNPASGFLDADIAIGPSGSLTMSEVAGTISLVALADTFPLNGIEGDVSLQFDRLVVDNGIPIEVAGTIRIANFVSRYLSPSPLGDFRAEFQTAESGILGTVEALSGMLDVAGTIRMSEDRSYEVVGQVAAKPGAPAGVRQQLQYLGTPDARGLREFRLEGRF